MSPGLCGRGQSRWGCGHRRGRRSQKPGTGCRKTATTNTTRTKSPKNRLKRNFDFSVASLPCSRRSNSHCQALGRYFWVLGQGETQSKPQKSLIGSEAHRQLGHRARHSGSHPTSLHQTLFTQRVSANRARERGCSCAPSPREVKLLTASLLFFFFPFRLLVACHFTEVSGEPSPEPPAFSSPKGTEGGEGEGRDGAKLLGAAPSRAQGSGAPPPARGAAREGRGSRGDPNFPPSPAGRGRRPAGEQKGRGGCGSPRRGTRLRAQPGCPEPCPASSKPERGAPSLGGLPGGAVLT